jgi:hypothetical protein
VPWFLRVFSGSKGETMPIEIHRQTESELLAEARRMLDRRLADAPQQRRDAFVLHDKPAAPQLTLEQQERRMRSLGTAHLPSLYERPRHEPPEESGAFVPATAARLDADMNLTDGARRCARKIIEESYRHDRENRKLQVTVSYLAKGLRRSGRTIQRYLRMLEREGYLRIQVLSGYRSRLCIGLIIHLLRPLFPRHHRDKWPERRGKPGVTKESENNNNNYSDSYNRRFRTQHDPRSRHYERADWAEKCMAGVCRALIRAVRSPDDDPHCLRGSKC